MGRKIYLTEEQVLNIIQSSLLNESLSDEIFHFTSIGNLAYIVKHNAFILSSVFYSATDFNIGEGYPFYMSFTRQFSNKFGYSQYKNSQDTNVKNQLRVRIEVDGRALSSRYVGKPVNYHAYSVKNNKQQQEAGNDVLKLVQIRQSEDRLFSKKPIIENADRYIRRIDILYDHGDRKNSEILYTLLRFMRNPLYKNKIFIYANENDFNFYHNTNYINDKIIQAYSDNVTYSRRFSGTDTTNDDIVNNYTLGKGNGRFKQNVLTTKQCLIIAHFLSIICYLDGTNDFISYINQSLEGYDIGSSIKNVAINKIYRYMLKIDVRDSKFLSEFSLKDLKYFPQNMLRDTRIIFANINRMLYQSITKIERRTGENLTIRNIIMLIKKNQL